MLQYYNSLRGKSLIKVYSFESLTGGEATSYNSRQCYVLRIKMRGVIDSVAVSLTTGYRGLTRAISCSRLQLIVISYYGSYCSDIYDAVSLRLRFHVHVNFMHVVGYQC